MIKRACAEAEAEHRGLAAYGLCWIELNAARLTGPETGEPTTGDHAARIETSWTLELEPELVRLDLLEDDPEASHLGVYGRNPRFTASRELGRSQIDAAASLLGERARRAARGRAARHVRRPAQPSSQHGWPERPTLRGEAAPEAAIVLHNPGTSSRYISSLSLSLDGKPVGQEHVFLVNHAAGRDGRARARERARGRARVLRAAQPGCDDRARRPSGAGPARTTSRSRSGSEASPACSSRSSSNSTNTEENDDEAETGRDRRGLLGRRLAPAELRGPQGRGRVRRRLPQGSRDAREDQERLGLPGRERGLPGRDRRRHGHLPRREPARHAPRAREGRARVGRARALREAVHRRSPARVGARRDRRPQEPAPAAQLRLELPALDAGGQAADGRVRHRRGRAVGHPDGVEHPRAAREPRRLPAGRPGLAAGAGDLDRPAQRRRLRPGPALARARLCALADRDCAASRRSR